MYQNIIRVKALPLTENEKKEQEKGDSNATKTDEV